MGKASKAPSDHSSVKPVRARTKQRGGLLGMAARQAATRREAEGGSTRGGDSDGDQQPPSKVSKKCPEGVRRCLRCQQTSQVKRWAAEKVTKTPGGERKSTAHGDACLECFEGWQAALRAEWLVFEDMVKECKKNRSTAERVDNVYRVYAKQAEVECEPQECDTEVSYSIKVDRSYIVLNEREMRAALGTARLLKGSLRGLRTMMLPSEQDPSTDEKVWVFQDPTSPHRRATVSTALASTHRSEHLAHAGTYYKEQGRFVLKRQVEKSQADAYALLTAAKLPTLSDHIAAVTKPDDGSGDDGMDSGIGEAAGEEDEGEAELIGPAAASMLADAVATAATPQESPSKSRPPVPAFASAAASSTAASVRRGSSVASIKTSSDEGSDEGSQVSDMPDFAEGGDWTAYWKSRLPLASLFVGPPKGRTMKALKDRIGKLSSSDETADQANRLKNFQHLASMAEQLHPSKVTKLAPSQLTLIANAMVAENIPLPGLVHKLLVENRIAAALKGDCDMASTVRIMTPWSTNDASFNVADPLLGKLDEPTEVRVEIYRRVFWRKFFAPLLIGDLTNSGKVTTFCKALRQAYEEEDLLELDGAAAAAVSETITACNAIEALYLKPTDPKYEAPLLAIQARAGKSDRSILTCVSSAVHANELLLGRMRDLLKAMPVIIEFGPTVRDCCEGIPYLKPDCDSFAKLGEMCKTLGRINASAAADLFDEFGKKLNAAIIRLWGEAKRQIDHGSPSMGPLPKGVQACFAEASLAFSLDDNVANAVQEVAEFQRVWDSKGRTASMMDMLTKGSFDLEIGTHADWRSKHASLATALADVHGITLEQDSANKLREAMENMLLDIALSIAEGSNHDECDSAVSLFDSMCQVGHTAWSPVPTFCRSTLMVARYMAELTKVQAEAVSEEDKIERCKPSVVGLGSAAMTCRRDSAKCARMETSKAISTLVAETDGILKKVEEALCSYHAAAIVEKRRALAAAVTACESAIGDLATGDGKWHDGVQGGGEAAWTAMMEKATAIHGNIDMKGLDMRLTELDAAIDGLNTACNEGGKINDHEEATTAVQRRQNFTVISVELHLMWHMKSEGDKNSCARRCRRRFAASAA